MRTAVNIWSEGTRMSADLFVPDDLGEGERRPTILLCHGWAGPKSHLSKTWATYFCNAGFVCLTFDYRGWYESDARIATTGPMPAPDADGWVTVRGKPVREVVDPLDQNRDIHNCILWLLDQPAVDSARLGLWGSSFGGGHVVHVAGHDPRVKAVVSQVPGMGQAPDKRGFAHIGPEGQQVGAALTRAELTQVPRPAGMPDSLKGAGDARTLWLYYTRRAAAHIRVPILIIDQEQEEYGGRENSGLAAHQALPEGTVSEYVVLAGSHYDIYDKNYRQAAELARDWFLRYL
jgi:dienelactone hydrolase